MEKGKARLKRDTELSPSDDTSTRKTLADLGIAYDQSSRWQRLAEISAGDFETAQSGARPTTSGILNAAKEPSTVASQKTHFSAGRRTRRWPQ
jgi:hypothetical protein